MFKQARHSIRLLSGSVSSKSAMTTRAFSTELPSTQIYQSLHNKQMNCPAMVRGFSTGSGSPVPVQPRTWLNVNLKPIRDTFTSAYIGVQRNLGAKKFQRLGLDAIKYEFKMTCSITDGTDQNGNPTAKMVHRVPVEINQLDENGEKIMVDVDHVIHTVIITSKCILKVSIGSFDKEIAQERDGWKIGSEMGKKLNAYLRHPPTQFSLKEVSGLHGMALKVGLLSGEWGNYRLVSLYGKAGSLEDAEKVFQDRKHKTIKSYNALMFVYSKHSPEKARELFRELKNIGLTPTTVTLKASLPYGKGSGGTCVAIAGSDYCVIAADTRMSTGYSIRSSRDYSRIHKLADKAVLSSSGFHADVKALKKVLQSRHLSLHNKQMSCPEMAKLLSATLYFKRFFPYDAFNVLGGLDEEGKGCVFTYDAVGSYEKVGYNAQGSGSTLIMPFLDNQLKSPSPLLLPAQDSITPLSEAEAVDLVKTVFASATERDIYTGDSLEIMILKPDWGKTEFMSLRKD